MKPSKYFNGVIAFLVVLFSMPIGHAAMVLIDSVFGPDYKYLAAVVVGFLGFLLLIVGFVSQNKTKSTFFGLFAGLFIWTGWVEFTFVFYAEKYNIAPLVENGEIVTKPEYLLLPSSVPFLLIILLYFLFSSKSSCPFFSWFQRKLKIRDMFNARLSKRNAALSTMIELTMLLWTFYIVLLIVYDEQFAGDKHWFTYLIAFGSLLWSVFLMTKLLKIKSMAYAIRYSIPTVIIFWNFVEILGRWNLFTEIWIEPMTYWLEMLLIVFVFVFAIIISFAGKIMQKKKSQIQIGSNELTS